MTTSTRRTTEETELIEAALRRAGYERVEAYRYNPVSIRVRVIDPRFTKMDRVDRHEQVEQVLAELPDELQQEITVLLLLAPGEERTSMMNLEFENPSPSML